jgi:hypothetical protein
MDLSFLKTLYQNQPDGGGYVSVYLDTTPTSAGAGEELSLRWRAARERLAGAWCRTAEGAIGGPAAVTEPRQSEESLIALAEIMVTEQSLEKTLRQVLELTCAALPGGDEGGITLLEAGGPHTVELSAAAF